MVCNQYCIILFYIVVQGSSDQLAMVGTLESGSNLGKSIVLLLVKINIITIVPTKHLVCNQYCIILFYIVFQGSSDQLAMVGTLESRSNSSISQICQILWKKKSIQVNHCFTVCHNSYHYYNTIDNEQN